MDDEELSLRALEIGSANLRSQKEDLRTIRNQAGFCAAFSSILATAFASLVPSGSFTASAGTGAILGVKLLPLLVITMLLLSLIFAARVMSWKLECTFEIKSSWLVQKCFDTNHGFSRSEVLRRGAEDAQEYFDANEKVIGKASAGVALSLCFSFAQFCAWIPLILGG